MSLKRAYGADSPSKSSTINCLKIPCLLLRYVYLHILYYIKKSTLIALQVHKIINKESTIMFLKNIKNKFPNKIQTPLRLSLQPAMTIVKKKKK